MGRGNPRAQFDPGSRTISRPEWRASDFGRRAISHSGFRRPDCFGASGSVDIATTCRLRPCSGECSTSARQPCHFLLSCINRWGHLTGRTELHATASRSEEHTSELQSRGHLVCRLLLEKKKKP